MGVVASCAERVTAAKFVQAFATDCQKVSGWVFPWLSRRFSMRTSPASGRESNAIPKHAANESKKPTEKSVHGASRILITIAKPNASKESYFKPINKNTYDVKQITIARSTEAENPHTPP